MERFEVMPERGCRSRGANSYWEEISDFGCVGTAAPTDRECSIGQKC